MKNNSIINYQPYPKLGTADRESYFTRLMMLEIFDETVFALVSLLERIFDKPVFFMGATIGNSSGAIL